jgi:hypothetical protein
MQRLCGHEGSPGDGESIRWRERAAREEDFAAGTGQIPAWPTVRFGATEWFFGPIELALAPWTQHGCSKKYRSASDENHHPNADLLHSSKNTVVGVKVHLVLPNFGSGPPGTIDRAKKTVERAKNPLPMVLQGKRAAASICWLPVNDHQIGNRIESSVIG